MPSELVVVGRVGAAHGVRGLVRITSLTDPPDNICRYRPWMLGRDSSFREVRVVSVKPQGPGFLARIEGVDDREAAQALTGELVAVPRSVLPALEEGREYYWRDLIGLSVVDASGRLLGQVDHLMETGAHDVMVIRQGERETLVPFTEPFVLAVDLAAGSIEVDWAEPR